MWGGGRGEAGMGGRSAPFVPDHAQRAAGFRRRHYRVLHVEAVVRVLGAAPAPLGRPLERSGACITPHPQNQPQTGSASYHALPLSPPPHVFLFVFLDRGGLLQGAAFFKGRPSCGVTLRGDLLAAAPQYRDPSTARIL